jgi:septal ring factor EnvC (AmiA/AmiB activator)
MTTLPQLPRNPTKQAEIEYYAALVAALPRASYLAALLRETVEPVTEQIRNDLALPDTLPNLWRQQAQANRDLAATRQAVSAARRELEKTRADLARAHHEAEKLRNDALDSMKDFRNSAEFLAGRLARLQGA